MFVVICSRNGILTCSVIFFIYIYSRIIFEVGLYDFFILQNFGLLLGLYGTYIVCNNTFTNLLRRIDISALESLYISICRIIAFCIGAHSA